MSHLDEGTIHAWIDGALDAERARAVEAHVSSCAQCSAMVAEARGLVAGASRILNALDEVPAGVMPKGTPAWSPKNARPQRAAPWVTGIAAALVLAIGITTWRRNPDIPLSDNKPIQTRTVTVFDSTVAAATAQREAAVATFETRAKQPTALRSRVDLSSRGAIAGAKTAGAASGAGVADASVDARDKVVAAPSPASTAPTERKNRTAGELAAASEAPKKAEALPQPSAALAPPAPEKAVVMMKDAPDEAARTHARAVAAAGCYRIEPAVVRRGAASEAVKAAGSAGARAPSAAPQARALANDAVMPAPARVQLDTTPVSGGYAVRAVPDGQRIGFWYRLAADSLRVELLVSGAFTIPASARTTCPGE